MRHTLQKRVLIFILRLGIFQFDSWGDVTQHVKESGFLINPFYFRSTDFKIVNFFLNDLDLAFEIFLLTVFQLLDWFENHLICCLKHLRFFRIKFVIELKLRLNIDQLGEDFFVFHIWVNLLLHIVVCLDIDNNWVWKFIENLIKYLICCFLIIESFEFCSRIDFAIITCVQEANESNYVYSKILQNEFIRSYFEKHSHKEADWIWNGIKSPMRKTVSL